MRTHTHIADHDLVVGHGDGAEHELREVVVVM